MYIANDQSCALRVLASWLVVSACSGPTPPELGTVQSEHDASLPSETQPGPTSESISEAGPEPTSESLPESISEAGTEASGVDAGHEQLGTSCGGWSQLNDASWVVEIVVAASADMLVPQAANGESAWTAFSSALGAQLSRLNGLHAIGLIGYSSNSDCPLLDVEVPTAPLDDKQRLEVLAGLDVAASRAETFVEASQRGALALTLNEFSSQAQTERYRNAEHIVLLFTSDVGAQPEACGTAETANLSEQLDAVWNDPAALIRPTLVVIATPSDSDAAAALSSWAPPPAGEIIDCTDLEACTSASGAVGSVADALEYWLAPQYLGAPDISCDFTPDLELDSGMLRSIEVEVQPFEGVTERRVATQTDDCSLAEWAWTTDGERVTLCPPMCDWLRSGVQSPGAGLQIRYLCAEQ